MMQEGAPIGGEWNLDAQNRKALPAGLKPPARPAIAIDAITEEVLALVERRFPRSFRRSAPFRWGVTRREALVALRCLH